VTTRPLETFLLAVALVLSDLGLIAPNVWLPSDRERREQTIAARDLAVEGRRRKLPGVTLGRLVCPLAPSHEVTSRSDV